MMPIKYKMVGVGRQKVLYREAGDADVPRILLLPAFPSPGHMLRELIPLLAERFHLVTPDLPDFEAHFWEIADSIRSFVT